MHTTTLDALALPETPPSALRLFRDGWNDTVKGRFLLDAEGAAEILRRFAAHGVELAMDFDHGTFADLPSGLGTVTALLTARTALGAARVHPPRRARTARWTSSGSAAMSASGSMRRR